MTDRPDMLARIRICFKIGAEGSFGVTAQGKGCVFYQQDLTKASFIRCGSCKEFFKFRSTVDRHCFLAWLKKGDR